jgi:hypothetical protein
LPEKHSVTYSNGTEEDEKDRRWELRQEDSRLKLKGAKERRLDVGPPAHNDTFPLALFLGRRPEAGEFIRLRAENQTNEPEERLHTGRLYGGPKGRTIGLSFFKILSSLNA